MFTRIITVVPAAAAVGVVGVVGVVIAGLPLASAEAAPVCDGTCQVSQVVQTEAPRSPYADRLAALGGRSLAQYLADLRVDDPRLR